MKDILLIPNIKIHNANALSSPYTIGFPAMTAWLGFMHSLERKLQNTEFKGVKLTGIIVYKPIKAEAITLIQSSRPVTH